VGIPFIESKIDRKKNSVQPYPQPLGPFAPELYSQISKAPDKVSVLVAVELQTIARSVQRHKQWEVIYAPVWATYRHEAISAGIADTTIGDKVRQGYRLLTSVAGSHQTGVDPVHRRAYRHASKLLEMGVHWAATSGVTWEDRLSRFQLRMDWCYANLLLCLVTIQPEDCRERAKALILEYERLTDDYPQACIPHFRLHLIYENLYQQEADSKSKALAHLDAALLLSKSDPFLVEHPDHWVKSTIIRRYAVSILEGASKMPTSGDTVDTKSAWMAEYRERLCRAFALVYNDFDVHRFPEADPFYKLEKQRRINNIVYFATLYLAAGGEIVSLADSSFTKDRFRIYLGLLLQPSEIDNRRQIENVRAIGIVHTIGCAYSALGEVDNASRAAQWLIQLIVDSGVDPASDQQVMDVLSDAVTWGRPQGAAMPAVAG